ncbi:MAG: glycosyltransferase family 4 protein [Patescibacteria group bacterium]|nr:glycosyltransferase family 4 protein [Patescibacteria group bacterium]MDD5121292.1 glycosyltransferase family 4 protein [Patescibacteria group bacterium]MDD5221722.1 glycosyltransferase family 4 protein [Patescibacteria group bacterium]MDD5395789.1 glycosyltransferase family 4 protein [Patescibacteria group bacterium]
MIKSDKKICLVSGDYPPCRGGLADYTKCLYDELIKNLNPENVYLVTSTEDDMRVELKEKNIFKIIPRWNFGGIIKLFNFIRKIKPDIVHIQYPTQNYKRDLAVDFFPFILKLTRPKVGTISTLHEFSNRSLLGKLRLSISILFSSRIIVVSKLYKKDILKFLWPFRLLLESKIIYIPDGANILPPEKDVIDLRIIQEIKERIKTNNNDFIICFFGSIRLGKGIEFLLNALDLLIKNGHSNFKLLFIGQFGGDIYKRIREIIELNHLEKHVHFTGYCSPTEVSYYLLSSDACVLPFEDGVSTKRGSLMAAIFHKLPIISTFSKNPPDELINEENILLVNYGNVKELKETIIRLSKKEDLRSKLREGLVKILDSFSWQTITNKTIGLYQDILSKSKN